MFVRFRQEGVHGPPVSTCLDPGPFGGPNVYHRPFTCRCRKGHKNKKRGEEEEQQHVILLRLSLLAVSAVVWRRMLVCRGGRGRRRRSSSASFITYSNSHCISEIRVKSLVTVDRLI